MHEDDLASEEPLYRRIYGTELFAYECFDAFLAVLNAASACRVFYYREELPSDQYQLVCGFSTSDFQVYLQLPGESVSETECRVQLSKLERIVREKEKTLVDGRVEVTAQGDILQIFANSDDYAHAVAQEEPLEPQIVYYGGELYLAHRHIERTFLIPLVEYSGEIWEVDILERYSDLDEALSSMVEDGCE